MSIGFAVQWLFVNSELGPPLTKLSLIRVFNTGLGMVLIVSPESQDKVLEDLEKAGETVYVVGKMVERAEGEGCVIQGMEIWDH